MLLDMSMPIVEPAEALAGQGARLPDVLPLLRKLSLDEFGSLLFSMPDPAFPNLSKLLPRMAPEAMQKKYTGLSGHDSLLRSLPFIRQFENAWVRYTGRELSGQRILDFGCGYGRLIRLMYYYTDPGSIWGLDVSDEALELCASAGIAANLAKSEPVPGSLPTRGEHFDLAYSFSVFYHLSPLSAEACSEALRQVMNPGGILVASIRPIESWRYLDELNDTKLAEQRIAEFKETGFVYVPHHGSMGEVYGNAGIAPDFFAQRGWDVLGYDTYVADPLQVSLILRRP